MLPSSVFCSPASRWPRLPLPRLPMPTCRDFGCHGRDAVETFQAVVRREASQLGPRGYELTQIKASLEDATTLYPGIPTTNMDIVAKPLQSIGDAIEAKNSTMFAKAFGDLTTACNGCHEANGRGFIVVKVPTASPFSNQSFSQTPSHKSPRRAQPARPLRRGRRRHRDRRMARFEQDRHHSEVT